ncbi:GNAT family N-acetyltransferase [Thiomicrorhabdus sp.]|uniref:GNAT family N-acetyltransferase n=1 Tax=Thiomicrorhabdus sp. TaxID=2039724 RepID=UPI0029C81E68|nr:GNAT family N-acetyltransferase [Thiomicrorhabdus sp.]
MFHDYRYDSFGVNPELFTTSGTQRFVFALQTMQEMNQGIQNVKTELETVEFANHSLPATRNEDEYSNSYVCSLYNAYIDYARAELGLLKNPMLQVLLKSIIWQAGILLKWGKINRTLSINNWLFSTNLVPNLSACDLRAETRRLALANPHHSLTIRSLNTHTDAETIEALKNNGWLLMPSRQVYLFPNGEREWWKRNNVKNDQRLLRKTELQLVTPEEHKHEDFADVAKCFQKLFIDKHSEFNPQFSEDYLACLHRHKLVEFFSFRNDEGRIVATLGMFTQHNIVTAPIVGYDTDLPKSLGLYRLVMAQLLKLCYERNQCLNLSSGASHFKRQRGGVAEVEYTALYVRHLPLKQRLILGNFARLLNRFGPGFLQKYEL